MRNKYSSPSFPIRGWNAIFRALRRKMDEKQIQLRLHVWGRDHGSTVARHACEVALGLAILWMSYRLVLTVMPQHGTPISASSISPHASPAAGVTRASPIERLVDAHLFGVAAAAPQIIPAAESPITVSGILYSPRAKDSVAILTFNGQNIVSRRGTKLPDGESVADIREDRVVLTRAGQQESLRLDIKRADPNAPMSPAEFADDGHGPYVPDNPAHSIEPDATQAAPTAGLQNTARTPPRIAPVRFQSLQSIRGAQSMQRFRGFHPPVPPPPLTPPRNQGGLAAVYPRKRRILYHS